MSHGVKPGAAELSDTLVAGDSGVPSDFAYSVAPRVLLAGRYRLIELLGTGGMGAVYKAHDTELDEPVAIKTLRRELVDVPGALDRFRRELKLARRITHPCVARAHDLGEHEGQKFIAMELVRGRSLAVVLRERGPLPVREVVRIGVAVAEGLGAAHAAGVVHRDLKPDNVLLADDGRVVITDFGIACAIAAGSDPRLTSAGGMVGTPAYMAPEQVEAGEVDARADLYALGVLLFEALTGELPFAGDTPLALAAARLIRPPRDVSALRPVVPAPLSEVVRRALARAPASRFESATAFALSLSQCVGEGAADDRAPEVRPRVATSPSERTVAVYARASQLGDDAWAADGFADDLADSLCLARGIRVRAREAPRDGEDARALGLRAGVDVVIDSRIRRAGDVFRVSLRLVSVGDGFQLWARRWDAPLGDLLRIADEAACAIAGALAAQGATPAPHPTPAGEAVELYLRARPMVGSMASRPEGVDLLSRAIELAPDDPTILAAFAGFAARPFFRRGQDEGLLDRAEEAARRALSLAPHLAEPHVALAHVRFARDDDAGAVASLLRAKAAGPGLAEADELLGRILAECDLAVARVHLERALWIDPNLHFARIDLTRIEALDDRWARVEALAAELLARSPEHVSLLGPRIALWCGRESLAGDIPLAPTEELRAYQAATLGLLRTRRLAEDFETWVGEADAVSAAFPRGPRLFRQLAAERFGFVGQVDRALQAVDASIAAGLRDLTWMDRCPLLAGVRLDPRFANRRALVAERAAPAIEAYRRGVAAA